jgi:hypothetical protein
MESTDGSGIASVNVNVDGTGGQIGARGTPLAALVARYADAPVVNAGGDEERPDAPAIRIRIPRSIQVVKTGRAEEALAWRAATRSAFEWYFAAGYEAVELLREDPEHSAYLLVRQQPPPVAPSPQYQPVASSP